MNAAANVIENVNATARNTTTRPTAAVLAHGAYLTTDGKTAHGLVRGTTRFEVLGVVDPACSGRDAGEVLDNEPRGIPIFPTLAAFIAAKGRCPDCCVIGAAPNGGRLPETLRADVIEAARRGIHLVSGLHIPLADDPEIAEAARSTGATIEDVRRPRMPLRFWNGDVLKLASPRIPVLGTDMAVGKRTTCGRLTSALRETGVNAQMIWTGQTGWLQGYRHGFFFDATPNDFVTGALERAILECHAETAAQAFLIEGQSSLRNPAGPCGAEMIAPMGAKGAVLVHAPARTYYDTLDSLGLRIPPIEEEVELIRLYGADVLAVVLNTQGLEPEAAVRERDRLTQRLGRLVTFGDRPGIAQVATTLRSHFSLLSTYPY
jgi:uncharacterized NAD-dependent epimerase/dehydratase family protein